MAPAPPPLPFRCARCKSHSKTARERAAMEDENEQGGDDEQDTFGEPSRASGALSSAPSQRNKRKRRKKKW